LETSSVIERLVSGAVLTANADKIRPDIAVKRHMHVHAQLDDVARLLADDASLASRYAGHHLAKSVVYPLQRRSVSSSALVVSRSWGPRSCRFFSDCRCISPLPVAAAATVHATTAGDFSVPPTLVRLKLTVSMRARLEAAMALRYLLAAVARGLCTRRAVGVESQFEFRFFTSLAGDLHSHLHACARSPWRTPCAAANQCAPPARWKVEYRA
jgi:hypothetical protein